MRPATFTVVDYYRSGRSTRHENLTAEAAAEMVSTAQQIPCVMRVKVRNGRGAIVSTWQRTPLGVVK